MTTPASTTATAPATHAIIGTAGHIDHGKSALVRALTGQETDRLKEEKERGISIDLGFAYFTLADGTRAGVIDVPGHERFIRNMLAGAHGMDLVLFTVAADDGVMPQSEEHLDILHLLGAHRGIFVITKADLADDARLAEVRDEIELLADGTTLEGSPVIAVSSITGMGLDHLREEIARQLDGFEARRATGLFRLPLDRAFVIKGHGTVVTGTAMGAEVRLGQKLRVLPGGAEVRVRSIQVHGETVDHAGLCQRVALNLSGAERIDLKRGDVLADDRLDLTTTRFDALLEIRPAAKRALKNNQRVRFFLATAETIGRVIVLEAPGEIAPKHRALVQIVLNDPMVALAGDRFVIRDETNVRTLGGGVVLNPLGRRVRKPLEALSRASSRARRPLRPGRGRSDAQPAGQPRDAAGAHRPTLQHAPRRGRGRAQGRPLHPAFARRRRGLHHRCEMGGDQTRSPSMALATHHRDEPLAPGLEMEALRNAPALRGRAARLSRAGRSPLPRDRRRARGWRHAPWRHIWCVSAETTARMAHASRTLLQRGRLPAARSEATGRRAQAARRRARPPPHPADRDGA